MSNICILCNGVIEDGDAKFMIPLDRPYLNIIVHRSCYKSKSMEEVMKSIEINLNNLIITKNKKK